MRLANEEQSAISDDIYQADADLLSKKINLMTRLDIPAQLHLRLGNARSASPFSKFSL